jgi:hypothetical protein
VYKLNAHRSPRPASARPVDVLVALLDYCRREEWSGNDPYDALNSPILDGLPRLDTRFTRLVMTQVLKRSVIDFRALLRIPATQNPKALSLMLRATLQLTGRGIADTAGLPEYFIERLAALRAAHPRHWCWGYSFPWQTRTVLVPRHYPNLVCTTFVASAILDAWEATREPALFDMAASGARYIADELYFETRDGKPSFAYPHPAARGEIHNANLLAAALLLRVHNAIGGPDLRQRALAVTRSAVAQQAPDGSWPYGTGPTQRWVDNFHTGYNLSALRSIAGTLSTDEFDGSIQRGFAFYREHFIRRDGAARYFHDRTYPIDIHCVAQSILTLLEFGHLDPAALATAHRVAQWAIANMWDARGGFFYYRKLRLVTIRTSYMRWSQAWMLLALATLVSAHQAGP